jgi:microsomal prostaglandin-E synthase 2
LLNMITPFQIIRGLPKVASSSLKCFASSASDALPSIKLYQYAICPFCNKTKALMMYAGLTPEIVEVNPLTKSELKFSPDYRKVPIAIIDNQQVNGSDEIMDALLSNEAIKLALASKWTNMNIDEFRDSKWTTFANDDLAALLYPNLCRTWTDSYKAFGYVHSVTNFSTVQKVLVQWIGSFAMYMAASKIKKKRGIADEVKALEEVMTKLEYDGLDAGKKQFVSGKENPNLGDIAIFGTLRSIQGLPAHEQAVTSRDSTVIQEWYDRMSQQVAK